MNNKIPDIDPEGDELLVRASEIDQPLGTIGSNQDVKNNNLVKTYIDSDDDDKEFDDSRLEEE